jgi:hypothetical protein
MEEVGDYREDVTAPGAYGVFGCLIWIEMEW